MNNQTRKVLDSIMADVEKTAPLRTEIGYLITQLTEKLEEYKEAMHDAASMVEEMRDEEQEKYDNMSEGLQAGEKGQTLGATVSALDEALQALQACDEIEDIDIEFPETDDIISMLDNAKYAG